MSPTTKNTLIGLGVLAGAGFIGYILYRKVVKPQLDNPDINPGPQPADKPHEALPAGVPSGSIHVSKGQQVVAQVQEIAAGKTKGDRYAVVQAENTDAYGRNVVTFKSPIDGYFTGRLYVHGNKRFAELMKA
jgi:hypothetical protein